MTAINTAELNRPGVMSSYSSSGRKNNIHASKRQVAGSTFNQARLTAATKFLSPSKGGHVSARSIFSNGAPRYMSGQEMAMQFNRQSGQVSAFQSNNFISSGFNPIGMGNMFGMGMDPTIGTIMGLTNIGMSVLDKLGVFGKLNAAPTTTPQQTTTPPKTNGAAVTEALNGLGGTALSVNYGSMQINGDTNLPDVDSFGGAFDNDYNSINTSLSGDFDATKLSADVDKLVTDATSDLANAQANYNILTERQGEVLKAESDLSEKKTQAQHQADDAKTDLGQKESILKSNTDSRNALDEQLGVQDETYKNISGALKSAEGEKATAQEKVSTCSDALGTAQADLSNAEANVSAAKSALAKATPEQKAAAQAALNNAQANLTKAKQAKETAEGNLKDAKATVEKLDKQISELQSQKDDALSNLEKTRKDLQTLINQCRTAEKAVRNSQKNVDAAKTNFDNCNQQLIKLTAQQNSANGVKSQFGKYQAKMETLKANAEKATQLKAEADKAIAEKKPDDTPPKES